MSLLEVKALTIVYADAQAAAVSDVSFHVNRGESVGIVGESGSGKSQTALSTMGLLPKNARVSGSIVIDGSEMISASMKTLKDVRTHKASMIFQDPATALNPYLKIGTQLKRVLLEHKLAKRGAARKRCIELLDRVRLPDPDKQYSAYPHQLSGGMRQRALIAAALIGEPELLVADEPTTALDVTVQAQILELLSELQSDLNTGLLLITHDLGVIANCCDRVLVMNEGAVVEEGLCVDVFAGPKSAYTRRMIEALPKMDVNPRQRSTVLQRCVLELKNVSVRYRDGRRGSRNDVIAVQPISLSVKQGETLAVVGESGSGKTSLARSIAGLIKDGTGNIRVSGVNVPQRVEHRSQDLRRRLQMVFQDPVSSLNPAMRVGQIIGEAIALYSPSKKKDAIRPETTKLLHRVGLDGSLRTRYPHELSGGQAQRVAIARALAPEPSILICDEALAALDGTVRRDILELLRSEQERSQMALILITHDLGVVREISDRVIVMYQGEVCEQASNEELFSNPQHEYTRALLKAVPTL